MNGKKARMTTGMLSLDQHLRKRKGHIGFLMSVRLAKHICLDTRLSVLWMAMPVGMCRFYPCLWNPIFLALQDMQHGFTHSSSDD